jgi:hypothetical protein
MKIVIPSLDPIEIPKSAVGPSELKYCSQYGSMMVLRRGKRML